MKDVSVLRENIPTAVRLTCIIPIRATTKRDGAIQRLGFSLLDQKRPADVGFLVVDDGSDEASAAKTRRICQRQGFGYLRLDTEQSEFSVGRCRNHGAMYATSKYILMQDADLMPYDGLYRNILNEIEIQGLDRNARDFLMFGYIFLTEEATEEYIKTDVEIRRQKFFHYALVGNPDKMEKLSTGTSANLYNREYYLARGGNSPDFEGWGYEDLEFNTRCVRLSHLFPVPRDWQNDRKNFSTIIDYVGWKASYRLFGDTTFFKGIAFFHAWHPVDAKSDYMQLKERNRQLFVSKMAAFIQHGAEPDTLPSKMEGSTLLFRSNPFVFHREIRSRLGDVVLVSEEKFGSADEFEAFVRGQNITRVMFHNPYANEWMGILYQRCRDAGLPFVVSERGALRNSLFFDHTGFLSDGTSYSPSHWDRPMSADERDRIITYCVREKQESTCLEAQGKRISGHNLRNVLRIPAQNKVLFLALQRPADSVTNFHCGPVGTYDDFIAMVHNITSKLPWNWTLVVKKHPLEDQSPEFDNAIFAHGHNIKDLLDMSDAVLTLNSGTGVLAMLWQKPVFYAGQAFYGHDGMNMQVRTADQLIEALEAGFKPDPEKILRFLSYLVHEFYSFGEFVTKPVKMPDGGNMTATTDIRFQVIRGIGQHETPYIHRAKSAITWESSLFDRYRFAEQQHLSAAKQNNSLGTPAMNVKSMSVATEKRPILGLAGGTQHLDGLTSAMVNQRSGSRFQRKLRKLVRTPFRFFADLRIFRGMARA
ncbi:hypothetical protein N825_36090 [Skermanella stibiiresistens SB22]|uniref:Glycosyltransferase 2-like prokaryotic type domain-containing protein n=1 Tax=Skermanella stibiiresistens SB22 TaxID=1385369 RepID=W9GSU9_9PROT|nr:hypothetical protein N825_36090 [Skermanella stibiiresistens SB22]